MHNIIASKQFKRTHLSPAPQLTDCAYFLSEQVFNLAMKIIICPYNMKNDSRTKHEERKSVITRIVQMGELALCSDVFIRSSYS